MVHHGLLKKPDDTLAAIGLAATRAAAVLAERDADITAPQFPNERLIPSRFIQEDGMGAGRKDLMPWHHHKDNRRLDPSAFRRQRRGADRVVKDDSTGLSRPNKAATSGPCQAP